ncbi:hypothetical protein ACFVTT_38600 [Streptomyces niveus]|uniref:hypothetical protein n=1 Tax=Streptomyces niveus TaxID=193462 RepID=UPI0034199067
MSKTKTPEPTEEPSRAAGACVVVVLAAGATSAVFTASPTAGVLGLWGVGTLTLWWSVRRTANPAPPPLPEPLSDTKPQYTVTEDEEGRCTVHWPEEVNKT